MFRIICRDISQFAPPVRSHFNTNICICQDPSQESSLRIGLMTSNNSRWRKLNIIISFETLDVAETILYLATASGTTF